LALETKRLIAFSLDITNKKSKESRKTHLMESVQHTQHSVGSSPPDVVVKGDAEGVDKSNLKLEGFECLDVLTRRLDLYQQVRCQERKDKKGGLLEP